MNRPRLPLPSNALLDARNKSGHDEGANWGTFSFDTIGENANGLSGAIFKPGKDGKPSKVALDYYDRTGLGSFVRE